MANIFTFFSEKHQSQTFLNLSGRSSFREIHKNPDLVPLIKKLQRVYLYISPVIMKFKENVCVCDIFNMFLYVHDPTKNLENKMTFVPFLYTTGNFKPDYK